MKTANTTTQHEPAAMIPDRRTMDFHTKSYSYTFECPTCHHQQRQNTNFLGRKDLVCDGARRFKVAR
jgi:hypothetical protein